MRTLTRWRVLAAVHFFVGATAIVGGGSLVVWPNGSMLHAQLGILAVTPFNDFLIPGLLLYGVVGVLNVVAAFFTFRQESGADLSSLLGGIAVSGYVLIEMVMLQTVFWLPMVYLALGVALIFDAVWIHYSEPQGSSSRSSSPGVVV